MVIQGIHAFETRVRMSELGPEGRLLPYRVLEWMQEAAAFASSEAGYPPDRFRQMNAAWFIREILLVIEGFAEYGESVRVETWVSDLRRFRSRREYRVQVGNRRVAVGQADWFLLSFAAEPPLLRPLRPDDEMKAAFPIRVEHVVASEQIPEWPVNASSGEFPTIERSVRPSEIDHNGHVNHTHYLAWFDDHAMSLGNGPLQSVRLYYENDARMGEDVSLSCTPAAGGTYHEVRRDGQRLARAMTRRG